MKIRNMTHAVQYDIFNTFIADDWFFFILASIFFSSSKDKLILF